MIDRFNDLGPVLVRADVLVQHNKIGIQELLHEGCGGDGDMTRGEVKYCISVETDT